jgi:hypothetical protein
VRIAAKYVSSFRAVEEASAMVNDAFAAAAAPPALDGSSVNPAFGWSATGVVRELLEVSLTPRGFRGTADRQAAP